MNFLNQYNQSDHCMYIIENNTWCTDKHSNWLGKLPIYVNTAQTAILLQQMSNYMPTNPEG